MLIAGGYFRGARPVVALPAASRRIRHDHYRQNSHRDRFNRNFTHKSPDRDNLHPPAPDNPNNPQDLPNYPGLTGTDVTERWEMLSDECSKANDERSPCT